MKDADIRPILHRQLDRHYGGRADTVVIDEFGVHNGSFRIDVAVVNGVLSGYEIKSAKDNLNRLPGQASAYGDVFDHVTLVASECHIEKAVLLLPEWWGVIAVSKPKRAIRWTQLRPGGDNPDVSPQKVASLLWRDEAYGLLLQRGLAKGLSSASRHRLWEALAINLPLADLQAEVRTTIRHRRTNPDQTPYLVTSAVAQ